jgi:hypothetical protein
MAKMVMDWCPCIAYPEAKVKKIIGRGKTPQEIAELRIPAIDKAWCLLHPGILSDDQMHELACRFAEDALKRERKAGREPDPRSWAAIDAKRKWLRKAITDNDLAAARAAACAAAWDVARAAAMAAAMAAAYKRYIKMILDILEE